MKAALSPRQPTADLHETWSYRFSADTGSVDEYCRIAYTLMEGARDIAEVDDEEHAKLIVQAVNHYNEFLALTQAATKVPKLSHRASTILSHLESE